MTNVTATASGGNNNYGVFNLDASPTIKQSRISGSTRSVVQGDGGGDGGTAKIALTQLERPILRTAGTAQCFNNYNENLAAVNCPT